MRAAVYNGTRNLYQYMIAAAKSLLMYSNVEKIYFLIEDDIFPYEIPPEIECINVSNQVYFNQSGPNFNTPWTYMILLRAAFSKIFPNLDKILSLDVDTIVNENISDLWDIDISNYYYAAIDEPFKSVNGFTSINAGVMMINLEKLRQDKKDDEIIYALNTKHYEFPEQDCISELCQGYLYVLPPDYNVNGSVDFESAKMRKIIHYAANKNWTKSPIVKMYGNIPFNELLRDQHRKTDLDIIIPSYNNLEGLKRTLTSLYYPELLDWMHITVVDDGCNLNYNDIINEFPCINLIFLDRNLGPGGARAIGIHSTDSAYIMFVDCGDIILSKDCLLAIRQQLITYRMPDIYEWSWIFGGTGKISEENDTSTPAKVYKREFLDAYGLCPIMEGPGSYASEDCGFNIACYAAAFGYGDGTEHKAFYDMPIYQSIMHNDSLTVKNDKEFLYTCLPGVVANAIHCIQICERANLHSLIILDKLNLFLVSLYKTFLRVSCVKPELIASYWEELRYFYNTVYQRYEKDPRNEEQLNLHYAAKLKIIMQYTNRPNIRRFLNELATCETVPNQYFQNRKLT